MDEQKSATEQAIAIREAKSLDAVSQVNDFDWRKLPPPVLSQLLTRVPFKGTAGNPDYYLTQVQAMVFALRCYELGLSPFSSEIWFDAARCKANVTLEGKKKLARDRGYNFGPPSFETIERPWRVGGTKVAGFEKEIGIKCEMEVAGFSKPASYCAWLGEWYVSSSPVWKAKPEHMLATRAQEKAISMASGIGSSDLPNDAEIVPPTPPRLSGSIVTEVVEAQFKGE